MNSTDNSSTNPLATDSIGKLMLKLAMPADISQLIFLPLQGIAQGGQPIISFNYGAGNFDRVKKAFKIQLITCVAFTIVSCSCVELFPHVFIQLFNNKPELLSMATWALRVYCAGMIIFGVQSACQQTFVALGQAKISLLLACLRKIILLIPLIYILPLFICNPVFAVFLAEPIADVIAACTTLVTFIIASKKLFK